MNDGRELRPWLISALARSNPSAGLDGPAAELWRNATDAERQAAGHLLGQEAARLLYEAGVIRKAGTVLDVRAADVDRIHRRASALQWTRGKLGGRWQVDMTLGQALKTADPTIVADVVHRLRAAGFQELNDWTLPEELLDGP